MPLFFDGCCGHKGASASAKQKGWNVITLDINPQFNPDILADIRDFTYSGPTPDVMWFSPPCLEFSRSFLPWIGSPVPPDMSILLACMRIIHQTKPRYWIIENVKGAMRWFEPYLGKPRYVNNPYYLWGFFPTPPRVNLNAKHKQSFTSTRKEDRAKIPYALSNIVTLASESQLSFSDLNIGI